MEYHSGEIRLDNGKITPWTKHDGGPMGPNGKINDYSLDQDIEGVRVMGQSPEDLKAGAKEVFQTLRNMRAIEKEALVAQAISPLEEQATALGLEVQPSASAMTTIENQVFDTTFDVEKILGNLPQVENVHFRILTQ